MDNNVPWEVIALRLANAAARQAAKKAAERRRQHEFFGLEARARLVQHA